MIGDRTGFVHVGPYQKMDLSRVELDTPFSTYVYEDGYLGLANRTELHGVFLDVRGIKYKNVFEKYYCMHI